MLQSSVVPQRWGQSSPLQCIFCYKLPWMLDMELQDLMFDVLDSSLALVPLVSIPLFLNFGVRMFILCHRMLEVLRLIFIFTVPHC